tara:strand:- start:478 stop:654 length:177 start_codon:yes stop_codon:yes gene_type:complete
MVEEISINKSPKNKKKVKTKKKETIGLTDINEFQYNELQKLWFILHQKGKFDKTRITL